MNAAHIVTTSISPSASPSVNAAGPAASDPAPECEGALAFGLMLGEKIDAAALLGEKSDAPAKDLPADDAAQTPGAVIDPTTLGLQLNIPAVQTAPVAAQLKPEAGEAGTKKNLAAETLTASATDKSDALKAAHSPADLTNAAQDNASTDATALPAIAAKVEAPAFEVKPIAGPNESTQAIAALSHQNAARPAEQAAIVNLAHPVGTERWNAELGHNVTLLIKGDQTQASLHVTPPEMGPIEIKIDLNGDKASISFNVQQVDTRHALENALPRLREILAESGISLGQSQVNQQSAQQGQGGAGGEARTPFSGLTETPGESSAQVRIRVGLVDTFA